MTNLLEAERDRIQADIAEFKLLGPGPTEDDGLTRSIIHIAEEHKEWIEALMRSPYDISPCMICNKLVVCLPDGMPICDPCGEKGELP